MQHILHRTKFWIYYHINKNDINVLLLIIRNIPNVEPLSVNDSYKHHLSASPHFIQKLLIRFDKITDLESLVLWDLLPIFTQT